MSLQPTRPIRLHRFALSGHSHRVELMLSLLGLPFERIEVNLARGEHKQPAFLALNAFGEVPVIEDDGAVLADSNAILVYLAQRYDAHGRWLPRDALAAAHVMRWLGVAAGPLSSGPALARVEVLFGRPRDAQRLRTAERLFTRMNEQLSAQDFLAARHATLADVAMYAYTAHAPEGGVSLAPYPQVRAWLQRVEALPGFVGMQRSPEAAPLAA